MQTPVKTGMFLRPAGYEFVVAVALLGSGAGGMLFLFLWCWSIG